MHRKLMIPALAAALVLAACDQWPTAESTAAAEDYALVMFGDPGAALEGTMGPQAPGHPMDGRSGRAPLPDSLALTQAQQDSITVLKTAFQTANQPALDSLKTIFDAAKAARDAGATREEVHTILEQGKAIRDALRPAVEALHAAIRAVLTDAQRAWLDANRPQGGRRGGPGGRRGHRGPPPPPPSGSGD